ncbi:heavy metal translocating P-type ATPase [Lachnospiraceae bacterium LCP25S3_G4]
MTKEGKKFLIQLGIGSSIYVGAIILSKQYNLETVAELALFLAAYIVIGFSVIEKLGENIASRYFLDENFLIVIATIGAFTIGKYVEGVAVLLFFQIGMAAEAIAVGRSRRTIEKLMDIRPKVATQKVEGRAVEVHPKDLELHQIIIIRPGEKVPVDAVITDGSSNIDMKALTGESIPQEVKEGDRIFSGSINLTGLIEASVVRSYQDSMASKIFSLADNAINKKAETEHYITAFARVYTPLIVLFAILLTVVPSYTFDKGNMLVWVYRSLTFLVVACPSALIISVPLAFYGGIGAASKHGVLVKGSNYLEALAKTDTFIFDKTGTLTKGVFEVIKIHAVHLKENELLELTALGEGYSNHPIAQSIREAYGQEIDKNRVGEVQELHGFGVKATIDGKRVYIGNSRFMEQENIKYEKIEELQTVAHVAVDNQYAGYIIIADIIREDARDTMQKLKKKYFTTLVMLTGDHLAEANAIAKKLSIDYVYADLLPQDKVEYLEEFLACQQEEKLAFVGDGINDAPVLARADVGIAMGGLGSDAAIEAADIVLLNDELSKIISVIKIAKETLRVVQQNTVFSLLVKCGILLLAVFGYVTMWQAIFADIGVMILAIFNSVWVAQYPE